VWKTACISVVCLSYSLGHIDHAVSHGFLKLVEALLQVYSCLFSHSTKLYAACHYQHSAVSLSCCITCKDICVQQSHMWLCKVQWFQINPECTPKKSIFVQSIPRKLVLRKNMNALIWIEAVIEYCFNYHFFSEFLLQRKHSHLDDLFVAQNIFITLVTYFVDDISH